MEKKYQILQLFSTLDSQQCVNMLVEVCYKIALAHLRVNFKKVHKIILKDEIYPEDVAIDSIASLFEKDNSGCFHNILESFKSWQPPIKTEEDALFFLNKLVEKRVEQHISFLLRESDPFFSKIMDSVNYLIKKHNFKKTNYFGTVYITDLVNSTIEGKVISAEEFEKLPAVLFEERKNLLQNIFRYLLAETRYVSAVPLNALVRRLKELNISLYKITEETTEQNEKIEIQSIINEALDRTYVKLENTYLVKEKLSLEEVEGFKKTLRDLSEDIKDGGVNPGLFKYLSAHLLGLDERVYKQKYHNILEYLLKVLKENIARQL